MDAAIETCSRRTRYAVIIERAGSTYSAYAPDLPHCLAIGSSVAEAQRELQAAIVFHLSGLKEEGLPIPVAASQVAYIDLGTA